jgi:hypothetical protein
MRRPDEKLIGRFAAFAEDGRSYTVLELEKLSFRPLANGALIPVPGPQWLELESGERVLEIEPGEVVIAMTGQVLKSAHVHQSQPA